VDGRDYVVRDNPKGRRYELLLDGDRVGEILYSLKPEKIVLLHTEIDPVLEGTGLGGHLVADALDDIRSRGLHVVPLLSVRRGVHPAPSRVRRPRHSRTVDCGVT
jgi:uncharacterized protein